ncbi:MAG: hypothetical protein AAGU12_08575 [Clostridiales bacterium]
MIRKKVIIAFVCLGIAIAAGLGQHIYLSEKFEEKHYELLAARQAMEVAQQLQDKDFPEGAIPPLKEGQVKVTIRVDLYSALAGKIGPADQVSVGFVPAAADSGKVRLPGLVAEGLLIADVTNEKGKDIHSSQDGNAYAGDEVMLPAAVTLVCDSKEQALSLKEYEKAGSLFLMMAGAGGVN